MKPAKKFGPVLLDGIQTKSIYQALISSGNTDLASVIETKATLSGTEAQFAIAARRALNGNLEVDEEPVVSVSDDGAYVMAWHWVCSSEICD